MAAIMAAQHREARIRRLAVAVTVELVLCVGGYVAYSAVRTMIVGQDAVAIGHGEAVLHLERAVGLAFEHPLQSAALHATPLVRFLNMFYLYMYLPLIAVTAVTLFARERTRYTRARRTFLISGGMGLLIFALFPVAPPRLLPGAGFVDTIQVFYPAAYAYPSKTFVNQFAAVPSFHFGWTTFAVFGLWPVVPGRAPRAALAAIPPLMLLTIVITGNHYWLDAAAGLAVVTAAYWLAGLLDHAPRVGRALHIRARRAFSGRTAMPGQLYCLGCSRHLADVVRSAGGDYRFGPPGGQPGRPILVAHSFGSLRCTRCGGRPALAQPVTVDRRAG